MMPGVFISYRRSDSGDWTRALADHLNIRFGDTLVFIDLDDIKVATEWMRKIDEAIASSEVLLVVIGPRWLQIGKDKSRLHDPLDVLRKEIEMALRRGMPLVPILVGNANLPKKEELPDAIAGILEWQAVHLKDGNWGSDVERLIWRIKEIISPTTNEGVTLLQAHRRLDKDQQAYFALLDDHKASEALENTYNSLEFLNQVSPHYPQDPYLQLVRGYLHKNEAMALIRLKRQKEAKEAIIRADRVFFTICREGEWRMAGALNGMGSVRLVGGQYKQALTYINRALEFVPDYGAALEDRKTALECLKS
jgi:tetratricopeptide (TPR) repeat protein